jgi:hypothetical protein
MNVTTLTLILKNPQYFLHDQGQSMKMKMNQKCPKTKTHFHKVGKCKEMNLKCPLNMNTKGIVTL